MAEHLQNQRDSIVPHPISDPLAPLNCGPIALLLESLISLKESQKQT